MEIYLVQCNGTAWIVWLSVSEYILKVSDYRAASPKPFEYSIDDLDMTSVDISLNERIKFEQEVFEFTVL